MSEEMRQQMPSPFMPGMKQPMPFQPTPWQDPQMSGGQVISGHNSHRNKCGHPSRNGHNLTVS